jgi:hypothetical protein
MATPYSIYDRFVAKASGEVINNATVSVYDSTGALASIYVNRLGTSTIDYPSGLLDNPLTVTDGRVIFYADPGRYTISASTADGTIINYDFILSPEDPIRQQDGIVLTIETFADIATTTVTAGIAYYLKEYYAGSGTGGGDLVAYALGADTPNNVDIFAALPSGFGLKRINTDIDATHAGIKGDLVADDTTKFTRAASLETELIVDMPVRADSLGFQATRDTHLIGNGSMPNGYRKQVIPRQSTSDYYHNPDVTANHLRQFNSVSRPKVVLMGDSISTYFANSINRGDLLTECLRRALDTAIPNGVDFYNMAISGTPLAGYGSNYYDPLIPWYAGFSTSAWIDVVKAKQPDLLIFSWGMNDADVFNVNYMGLLIDYVNTWDKVPSIVFCTGVAPSPRTGSYTDYEIEARDRAAGWIRSYAKFRNVGLLDFNRKFLMAREGYDPLSTVGFYGDAVTAVFSSPLWSSTGTKRCYDFRAQITFNSLNMNDSTSYMVVRTGEGSNDFIIISKVDGATMRVRMFAGNAAGSVAPINKTYAFTWTNLNGMYLTFEKEGDHFAIYVENDPLNGQMSDPIVYERLVHSGGSFIPQVYSTNSVTILSSVTYTYGYPRVNTPSITDTMIFGTDSTALPQGGNGLNHPSSYAGAYVYRPVIDTVMWYNFIETIGNSGYTTNRYYSGELLNAGSSTSFQVAVNTFYASPVIIRNLTTWTRIGLDVVGTAAGNMRVGLYTMLNGRPSKLMKDYGTIATSTTGIKEITISHEIPAGFYAVCYVFDGTPTVRSAPLNPGMLGVATPGALDGRMSGAFTYGAFPSAAPTVTNSSAELVLPLMRVV